jgi:6-pyruvoyl-tetrahydropterin synthase
MWIDDKFDHTNLNDFMEKPTAENVAKEIANEIWQGLAILESGIPTAYSYPNLFKSIKVRLWENKDARVEIKIKCDQIRTNDSGEN